MSQNLRIDVQPGVGRVSIDVVYANQSAAPATTNPTTATATATPAKPAAPTATPATATTTPSVVANNGVTSDVTKPNNGIALHALQTAVAGKVQSRNSGGTADILPAERAKASFDVVKLTNTLDGSAQATARRHFILSPTEGLDASDKYYMDRHELVREHLRNFIEIHEKFNGKFQPTREEVVWMSENTMHQGTLMNHYGLFIPTLMGQGSDQQHAWWVHRSHILKIVGVYAQTELGHGSNVRGLQTIAEYDKNTQEFVLSTPTLQSMKWWPGTLGKVATHAAVYAQLLIDGKEHGVHVFMVQIRDENHRPLPGIELGDLGPKLGDAANDTGFMRLENVRIPREHMLCRYQEVTPDGRYVKSQQKTNAKLHYATMMFTRGGMCRVAGGNLARAVTIATRYSCVRSQGFVDTSPNASFKSQERQIIDYQVQRYRILKQLSLAYAIKFTGKWMTDRMADLEGSKATGQILDTTALPEIAATSAGLKALCTFLASQGIEECRKCCGGNGYLLNSGVAALAADYVWQTTAEGDWIVLMLQTARFLIKSLQNVRAGKGVSGPVEYLSPLKDPKFDIVRAAPAPATSVADFFNLEYLLKLYNYRALVAVVDVGQEFQRKLGAGQSFDEAWNATALQLCETVKIHCMAFMMARFVSAAQGAPDAAVRKVLSKVCALFGVSNILDDQWAGLGALLGAKQMKLLRSACTQLLDELRPDAVALVDAFDIPDRVLNSTLGRADGNVYEALYEAAKKSSLNLRDPFVGYEEVLRPRLDIDLLKNPNKKIDSKL